MTRDELAAYYGSRKEEFSRQLDHVKESINVISTSRLVVAAIFLINLYFGFSNPDLLALLVAWAGIFIFLVRQHDQLFKKRTHLENLVWINDSELKAIEGKPSGFKSGDEFVDPHHPYSHDLDLFGDGSLFQSINRSNTIGGIKKLADRLSVPLYSESDIVAHQEAIAELKTKSAFRQHFQATGLEIGEQPDDRRQLDEWLQQPSFVFGKAFFRIGLLIIPAVTIALVLGWIFFDELRPYAILMASVQWAILGLNMKRVNLFHDYISRKKNILGKYATLLHLLETEKFSSKLMVELSSQAKDAGKKVTALANLVRALDARLNAMTSLVANALVMYDLQCIYRLEKWKEENAGNLMTWLDAVNETELVASFGNFAFNNHHFNFPSIVKNLSLEASELGHPLIPPRECVTNDFSIGQQPSVLIITGANMAGKSTFLRALGVNLVLALNGAPVFAKMFSCPVINLRTGMRTADSLKDHQSYFYAELDRLKGIMDELRQDKPLLILLDEILKGTNSTDKQTGSIALVKQLLPHPCLSVIATHDLALGELEKDAQGKIKNYCFEPSIKGDQLTFDYKLKPGIAQKMNATFLMKKMGIIPS